MTEETREPRNGTLWGGIGALILIVILSFVSPVRGLAAKFFASLRIPKPQAVSVDVSAFSGANGNRTLQQMISQMISSKTNVTEDEADAAAADKGAAAKLAGFAVTLPAIRKDLPKIIVQGGHAVDMSVDRAKLQTIFDEAGRHDLDLPANLDGAEVTLKTPRSIRAQYGNCPAPPNTISGQINGPPPPSADNSDCLVVTEGPTSIVNSPAGLDVQQLVEIGLELSGMSPNQTKQFLESVDWKSTLSLAMPRFMRSFETVQINGAHGVLVNTLGRRGPTYMLIWVRDGMAYSLTGYASASDATALANSFQ
nr:hypothetical protein [Candidatus Acidoferrales bacterium]